MKVSPEAIATLRAVLDTLECDVKPIWVRTSASVLETLANQLKAEATESATPQQPDLLRVP
jgi:hypothetical protein